MKYMAQWITENIILSAVLGCVLIFVIVLAVLLLIKKKRTDRLNTGYPDFQGMDGHDFEVWCAQLLADNHFTDIRLTKGSGDQGVDILASRDDVCFAIQCKLYSSPLGNRPVQEVYAGKTIYRCHVGVVMTNSTFTSGAREAAEKTGVLLWDRDKLADLVRA